MNSGEYPENCKSWTKTPGSYEQFGKNVIIPRKKKPIDVYE